LPWNRQGNFLFFEEDRMQQVFTPLSGLYQCQLEASRRCADAIFSGAERIDQIMIDATHRAVTEQLNLAKVFAGAGGDPRTAGSLLQANFLGRQPGDAVSYQKEIVHAVTEMQSEIGRSLQDCMEQMRSQTATQASPGAVGPAFSGATGTSAGGGNPVTSIFSVWESAFKEVASLARTNMALAASAAESAIGQAAKTANAQTNAATEAASTAYQATRSVQENVENAYEERSEAAPAGAPANLGKKK